MHINESLSFIYISFSDTKWLDSEWLDADGLKRESGSESPAKELEKSFVKNEEVIFVSNDSCTSEAVKDEKDTLKLEGVYLDFNSDFALANKFLIYYSYR